MISYTGGIGYIGNLGLIANVEEHMASKLRFLMCCPMTQDKYR